MVRNPSRIEEVTGVTIRIEKADPNGGCGHNRKRVSNVPDNKAPHKLPVGLLVKKESAGSCHLFVELKVNFHDGPFWEGVTDRVICRHVNPELEEGARRGKINSKSFAPIVIAFDFPPEQANFRVEELIGFGLIKVPNLHCNRNRFLHESVYIPKAGGLEAHRGAFGEADIPIPPSEDACVKGVVNDLLLLFWVNRNDVAHPRAVTLSSHHLVNLLFFEPKLNPFCLLGVTEGEEPGGADRIGRTRCRKGNHRGGAPFPCRVVGEASFALLLGSNHGMALLEVHPNLVTPPPPAPPIGEGGGIPRPCRPCAKVSCSPLSLATTME